MLICCFSSAQLLDTFQFPALLAGQIQRKSSLALVNKQITPILCFSKLLLVILQLDHPHD